MVSDYSRDAKMGYIGVEHLINSTPSSKAVHCQKQGMAK
jgi:hypothetical protein